NAWHNREPDTGAWEFPGGMHALEDPKQLIGIGHVEASAVITDMEYFSGTVLHNPHLDPRRCQLRGELPGIVEEIFQDDAQQLRVAIGLDSLPDGYPHLSFGIHMTELLYYRLCHGAQIGALA